MASASGSSLVDLGGWTLPAGTLHLALTTRTLVSRAWRGGVNLPVGGSSPKSLQPQPHVGSCGRRSTQSGGHGGGAVLCAGLSIGELVRVGDAWAAAGRLVHPWSSETELKCKPVSPYSPVRRRASPGASKRCLAVPDAALHTSAGRVPIDRGYRYTANRLLEAARAAAGKAPARRRSARKRV